MSTMPSLQPAVYPLVPSQVVDPTTRVTLCVAPEQRFKMAFFVQGTAQALDRLQGWNPATVDRVTYCLNQQGDYCYHSGAGTNPGKPDQSWDWPSITFQLPPGLTPGVYFAVAYPIDASLDTTTPVGQWIDTNRPLTPVPPFSDGMALFVLTPVPLATKAPIAYYLPLATYHAYNLQGGACYYSYYVNGQKTPPVSTVTMCRPGGGVGQILGEPPDPYDGTSPRQCYAHWDGKFLPWLYRYAQDNAVGVDVFTDLDLDERGHDILVRADGSANYHLLVCSGHHEYWSENMRRFISTFVRGGGNVAILSGNTCYWQVRFVHNQNPWEVQMVKDSHFTPNEQQTIGLSYQYGAGRWADQQEDDGTWRGVTRSSIPYTLQPHSTQSWVFQGTGLAPNDQLGAADHLAGYECDGSTLTASAGLTTLASAATKDAPGWNDTPGNGLIVTYSPERDAGTLFNAGTTDWVRVMQRGTDHAQVEQITRNVLTKLAVLPER
jgi:hypothetical protein